MAALAARPAGAAGPVLEVEQDRVRAGDLARVIPGWQQVPQSTEVLYAPLPGLTRRLGRAELERLALRHGISQVDAASGPATLDLTRKMRVLDSGEAAAALAASIAGHYRISPEDVAVDLVGFPAMQVPSGELNFRSTGWLARSGEMTTIPLTWVTADRRSGTLWLRARLSVRGVCAVAKRSLQPNRTLAPEDIEFTEGPLPGPSDRWSVTPDQLAGKTLARPVAAGEKIPRPWLIGAKAIQRGAVVELRLASAGLELRVPARAEQSGAVGQRVLFRNVESGRQVAARVVNGRQAEVEPQGATK